MGDYTLYATIGILAATILGMIARMVWVHNNYKKHVTIKQLVNGGKRNKYIKCRHYIDKQRVEWWKCRKFRTSMGKLLPLPPSERVELLDNGQEAATCYIDETGQLIWQVDNTTDLKQSNVRPFTTKQKVIYVQNLKDAYLRNKAGWREHIVEIAALLMMFMTVAVLVFGYGEFAKPILDKEELVTQQMAFMAQIVEDQKEMNLNIQEIRLDIGLNATFEPGAIG